MGFSRSRLTALAAAFAVLGIAFPGVAFRSPVHIAGRFVPHQLIVRFDRGVDVDDTLFSHGARVLDRMPELNAVLIGVPSVVDALSSWAAVPGVVGAEPNMLGSVSAAPPPSRANDPLVAGIGPTFADRQWYLQRISAPYAWTVWPQTYYSARSKPRRSASTVKVAVLDTLIDREHEDWRNAGGESTADTGGGQLDLAEAKTFVATKDLDGANVWHGTHIAGIIGASADNTTDMAGIAYAAEIMPVTVAKGSGVVEGWTLAQGFNWASDHGARIINASLTMTGNLSSLGTLRAAVNRAVARGSLVVTAIGNTDQDDADYPAGFAAENDGVMAIGATGIFDERLADSKKGRHVTMMAPGYLMWSLDPQDHSESQDHTTRRVEGGTSYAAAVVSGVAALVAGATNQKLSPAQLALRLTTTADDLGAPGRDDEFGAGRINAERAVWNRGGPGTAWVSIPTGGPGKRITVLADAKSTAGVSAAEVLVDGRQKNKGTAARAADGRFGATTERVAALIDTSNMGEGPHEISVRARDGRGAWGPSSTSVLIVDRTPPVVDQPHGFPNSNYINPDDQSSAIVFAFRDTWSTKLRVKLDLIDATLKPVVTFVFDGKYALPPGGQGIKWAAVEAKYHGPVIPGVYRIIVNVTDQGGQSAYGDGPVVVLPSARVVPSPGSTDGPIQTSLPTAQPSDTPKPPTVTPTIPALPSPTITPTG